MARLAETTLLGRSATLTEEQLRESGELPRAKILGWDSGNGRHYLRRAVQKAVDEGKYDNRKIYIDHPPKGGNLERGFREWAGNIRQPIVEEDGLYARAKFRRKASCFEEIVEAATDPDFSGHFGFSHVADCEFKRNGKIDEVTEIKEVFSVDIVTEPATTNGLYESKGRTMKTTVGKILAATKESADKPFRKILSEMAMGDAPAAPADMEVSVDDGASTDDQVKAGLMQAVQAKLEAASADQLKKVLKALEIGDSISDLVTGANTAGSAPAGPANETPAAKEARETKNRLAMMESKALLLENDREAKEPWINALAPMDDAGRKAFMETLPKKAAAAPARESRRPASSPPANAPDGNSSDAKTLESAFAKRLEGSHKTLAESRRTPTRY